VRDSATRALLTARLRAADPRASSALDRARHARSDLLVGPGSRRVAFPQPAL